MGSKNSETEGETRLSRNFTGFNFEIQIWTIQHCVTK